MKELKLQNELIINFNNKEFDGLITNIEYDRFSIKVKQAENIDELNELDELKICAKTYLGEKYMQSAIIDIDKKNSIITVENSPEIEFEQKRQFVRVKCNFNLEIKNSQNNYHANAIDISACGIAINCKENNYTDGQKLELSLPEEIFGKNIIINGKIVKTNEQNYGIKYDNLNSKDEDAIMKYVLAELSKYKKME